MENIFFSVIVPVYNVEKYLSECLESIINQTYKKFECICVNDCSKDDCAKILSEYEKKDSRIRVINHSKNKGLGGGRNTGVENAHGKYVIFIDSDDYIDTSMLEQLNNEAIKYGNPDIIQYGFIGFNNNNGDRLSEYKSSEIIYATGRDLCHTAVTTGGIISACCKTVSLHLYTRFKALEHVQAEDIPTI